VYTKTKGKYGEDLAVSFLEKKGFEIAERNYRFARGEIDLIGILDNKLLVFFEVKFRRGNAYGEPESFVSKAQQKLIIQGAEDYIYAIDWHKDIRFDIISIVQDEIVHFEDAFY